MDARERKRIDRALRELNAATGANSHREGVVGLLIATAIALGIVGIFWIFFMPTGPGMRASGVVESIRYRQTETGARQLAQVTTEGLSGLTPVPAAAMCAAGDQIDLIRRKTLFGVRYTMGVGGCRKPGRVFSDGTESLVTPPVSRPPPTARWSPVH